LRVLGKRTWGMGGYEISRRKLCRAQPSFKNVGRNFARGTLKVFKSLQLWTCNVANYQVLVLRGIGLVIWYGKPLWKQTILWSRTMMEMTMRCRCSLWHLQWVSSTSSLDALKLQLTTCMQVCYYNFFCISKSISFGIWMWLGWGFK
jgi:hypothetical protein